MGKESKRKWARDLETKTSIDADWQVASVWGNSNRDFVALNSSGNSSGLLTVWDCNLFKMNKSVKHDGFIAVHGVWRGNNAKVGIINVYAPQRAIEKNLLWDDIKRELLRTSDVAWIVCGDFNEVRSAEERKGSKFDSRGANCFNDFIVAANLTDLRLGGRKFTWMNADCTKLSKLDRFLVNSDFNSLWPEANALALPRVFSDHCPILLETRTCDFGPIPFKFFNSWLLNPELENLVKEKWDAQKPEFEVFSSIERLSRKLRFLKNAIKEWRLKCGIEQNKDIDSLKQKISSIDLLAEVGGIDDGLAAERANLMAKLGDLTSAKACDLKQKAKSKWISDGDENSRYFHGVVNNKLKKSRIHGLNINGSWVTEPDKIKEATRDFFEKKFKEDYPVRPTISSSFFKKISDSQRLRLEEPFTEKEVKDAVWSCGENKAPGPDGFSFEFIQKFWSYVGKDFFAAVKFFEINKRINPGSNASFVTLVPKVRDPLSLADYRPINLIGCVSKVVSKVLAERLKGVLGDVISNTQTAFIKGRSILDGPLMADFAKAFDCLNWNYLDNVLLQMGFGVKWREWVKGCICTAKVSVLINGSPTKEFNMTKGVRQGDPLAPFLFILAAEGLTVAMKEARRSNLFQGVRFDNSSDEISNFQFADDTIFVGEWSHANALNLIRVLKCFEVCSGLKINLYKSRLSGVTVNKEEIAMVARQLKCKEETIWEAYAP
ncbi:hypothetical protein OSB04_000342 [Centaurea solstitialis]|uniref:Reverse transcriptase domain-containing protein n=1 Tax=Centaurea solstitialis TaxID=347529 RepID=A0AA38U1K0_9ASTR|nr:hypothetical protein OSB04_000342 [Centaurea solstitialis]